MQIEGSKLARTTSHACGLVLLLLIAAASRSDAQQARPTESDTSLVLPSRERTPAPERGLLDVRRPTPMLDLASGRVPVRTIDGTGNNLSFGRPVLRPGSRGRRDDPFRAIALSQSRGPA